MMAFTDRPWNESWLEWHCNAIYKSCRCSYPKQPILRLRGRCLESLKDLDWQFSPKQLPDNPDKIILVGDWSIMIYFNKANMEQFLSDARSNMTAVSKAS